MRSVSRTSEDAETGRRTPRLAAGLTGAAVVAVCLAYGGYSLFAGRVATPPAGEGVELGLSSAEPPVLSPTPQPSPAARLTLDDGTEPTPDPVMNAHLELAAEADAAEVVPAIQQAGFTPAEDASATRPVGVWLTGTIETLPPPARRFGGTP